MWVGLGFVGWAELGLRMGLWVGLGLGLFLAG